MLFYDKNHLIRLRTMPALTGRYLEEVTKACDYNAPEWDEDLNAYRVESVADVITVEGYTVGGVEWPLRDYIMQHIGEAYSDPEGEWIIGEYSCKKGRDGLYEEWVELKTTDGKYSGCYDEAVCVWYYMHKWGKEG